MDENNVPAVETEEVMPMTEEAAPEAPATEEETSTEAAA
jgi:hypothetical protein